MSTEYHKTKGKDKLQNPNEFHSYFLERLSEYPLVDYGQKTAAEFYHNLKKSNRLLRFGLEQFVEGNVGAYWAVPVKNTTRRLLGFIARPLLSKLDSFACYELDRFEDSDLIELPFTLFDRSLDIAEGTLDYFLEPGKGTLEIEHQCEETLDNENFELLDLEGKYMEAAMSRLRYLEHRMTGLRTSLKLRTRDVLSLHPIWMQLVDFVGARLLTIMQGVHDLLKAPGELMSMMNQFRNSVLGYVQDVTEQTVVLMYVAVEPMICLAQNAFDVSRKRLDQLVFNIEQRVDWAAGYVLPARLRVAVRRLFLLFRTFIATGRLNLKKVEETLKEAGPSEAELKHKKKRAGIEEEELDTQRRVEQLQEDERLKRIKSRAEQKPPTDQKTTTESLLTEAPRQTEKPKQTKKEEGEEGGQEGELPKAEPQMLQRDMPQWAEMTAPTEPRVGIGMVQTEKRPRTYAEALQEKKPPSAEPAEVFPKAQPEILQQQVLKIGSAIPSSEPRVGAWRDERGSHQHPHSQQQQPQQQQQQEGKPKTAETTEVKREEHAEKPVTMKTQQQHEVGKQKEEIGGPKQQIAERSKQDDDLARGRPAKRRDTGEYRAGTVARHVTHFEEMSKEATLPEVVGK